MEPLLPGVAGQQTKTGSFQVPPKAPADQAASPQMPSQLWIYTYFLIPYSFSIFLFFVFIVYPMKTSCLLSYGAVLWPLWTKSVCFMNVKSSLYHLLKDKPRHVNNFKCSPEQKAIQIRQKPSLQIERSSEGAVENERLL